MVKTKVKEKKLVREGYKLMREYGYNGMSVELVVANLSIPKGLFYYYFKTKEVFAEAVMVYYVTIVLNRLDRTLYDYSLSPKQRIVKLYSDQIDFYVNNGIAIHGNFATNIYQELGNSSQNIKELVTTFNNRIKDAHIDCIQAARRTGEIDKYADAEKLTLLIINSWDGAVLRVKSIGNMSSLFAFREILRDFILK